MIIVQNVLSANLMARHEEKLLVSEVNLKKYVIKYRLHAKEGILAFFN